MDESLKKLTVRADSTVKETLRRLDKGGLRTLFVVNDDGVLNGMVTDSDVRRHLLRGGTLGDPLDKCYNRRPTVIKGEIDIDRAKEIMLRNRWEILPVVDSKGRLSSLILWDEVFKEIKPERPEALGVPIVIMAGGKGTRLDPFTRILPKPLIPIGDKPIAEVIMDRFFEAGADDFYMTINYKGEMIKSYFDHNKDIRYKPKYIWEKKFLGTAGSLRFVPKKAGRTLIVSNCDIIVHADYNDILKYHRERKSVITLVGSIQHHRIPYGVLEYGKGGRLKSIKEKPEYDFVVNTGLYIIESDAMKFIPKNIQFDMNQLINEILIRKLPVNVYLVSEKAYVDIGQWEEYRKNIEKLTVE